MRPEQDLEKLVKRLHFKASADLHRRTISDAMQAQTKSRTTKSAQVLPITWRFIMKNNASKLAVGILIIAILLSFFVFERLSSPAWALEDSIEALRSFQAVHVVGAFPGGTAEIWMRADKAKTRSTDVVVKGSQGTIMWTKDGSTYHYEPSQNTVYFENALTVGLSQWLGPELLEMLSTAENAEVVSGKDPATGRDRATLFCSLVDVHGAQSWIIEFDVASKLPVAFKQWQNLDRSGPPAFDAFKVTYYENLPDSIFAVHIPGQPVYVQKPLTIPEENIGVLSGSRHGIPTEGMTQQEAAERIVRAMFQAIIDADLPTLKKMCPLCENWGDEFLRSVILKTGKDEQIVEILNIGQISETGRSKLGPIVALPISVKRQDGVKAEQKMIVQFRQLGGVSSCVVHGPYGLPHEIK